MARNQDDHTKNIAFLMDRSDGWRLAPAYDLIYACNPSGAWTHRHQMTFAGKRDNFTTHDLLSASSVANLKSSRAKATLHRIHTAVSLWQDYAEFAKIPHAWALQIQKTLRLDLGR